MTHLLALAIPNTGNSVNSILLWLERSARLLVVFAILGIFLAKRGFSWQHLLEMLVLLILGMWFIPSMVPPQASKIIASMNTGGAAGTTGVSWGMLAFLIGLLALVVFAFK